MSAYKIYLVNLRNKLVIKACELHSETIDMACSPLAQRSCGGDPGVFPYGAPCVCLPFYHRSINVICNFKKYPQTALRFRVFGQRLRSQVLFLDDPRKP